MNYFEVLSLVHAFAAASSPSFVGIGEIFPFVLIVAFIAISIQANLFKKKEVSNEDGETISTQATLPSVMVPDAEDSEAPSELPIQSEIGSIPSNQSPLQGDQFSAPASELSSQNEVNSDEKDDSQAPEPAWGDYF